MSGLTALRGHHENGKLARSFEKANRVAGELKNTVGMLKNQLQVVAVRAEKNERAQVDLRQKLAAAGDRAVRREQTITRLLNENEAFRRWYSADLPDAVRRVHHRAACASARSEQEDEWSGRFLRQCNREMKCKYRGEDYR